MASNMMMSYHLSRGTALIVALSAYVELLALAKFTSAKFTLIDLSFALVFHLSAQI